MSRSPTPKPPAQLALRFPLAERARFDTFVAGANDELVGRLENLAATDGSAGFQGGFLHGPRGAGRSHLLQATCQRYAAAGGAIYLPVGHRLVTPAVLEGLDTRDLVALDDVEGWLGEPAAEAALLGLYQGLLAAGGRLLVSAAQPASALDFHYPDLASRLRGLPAYRVQPLDDAGKGALLTRLAAERGLELGRGEREFWLSRGARDLPTLLADLDRLDEASMAQQRRITVPLIKQVLGL